MLGILSAYLIKRPFKGVIFQFQMGIIILMDDVVSAGVLLFPLLPNNIMKVNEPFL